MSGLKLISSLRYDTSLLSINDNGKLSGPDGAPSAFYMLRYHRDRLLDAARHFRWECVVARLEGADALMRLQDDILGRVRNDELYREDGNTSVKVNLSFNRNGALEIKITAAPSVSMDALFPSRQNLHKPLVVSARTGGALYLGATEQDAGRSMDMATNRPWRVVLDAQHTTASPFTRFKTTQRGVYMQARERAGIGSFHDPTEVLLVNRDGEVMEGSFTNVYLYRNGHWVTPPLSSGGLAGTVRRWLLEHGLCREEVILASSLVDQEDCYLSNGVRGVFRGMMSIGTSRSVPLDGRPDGISLPGLPTSALARNDYQDFF